MRAAQALHRKGDFDDAILNYQAILQNQPKAQDACAGLTRVYLKKKDVERAFETAGRGRLLADSPAVRIALGEVYFRQGKIHEAEDEWVNLINPGHREARAYLGMARVRWAIHEQERPHDDRHGTRIGPDGSRDPQIVDG